MTLTDEQLDALAQRLAEASFENGASWITVAREAARWAEERERERLEPLRVAVEALSEAAPLYGAPSAAEMYAAAHVIATARTLLETDR